MLNKLSYYLLVIVAIMIAACSDVEEILTPAPDQSRIMSFNIGNQTKVSTDDITSQEFIIYDYIYGAEGYTDGTCYIDGSKVTLKYRNDRWDFYSNNGDTRVDFLWTKTGEHRFYAFNNQSFYVIGDGTPDFVYNSGNPRLNLPFIDFLNNYHADLIYASTSRNLDNESNKYASVNLTFKHAFSSLLFEVKNEYDSDVTVRSEVVSAIHKLKIEGQPYLGFDNTLNITLNSDTNRYQSEDITIQAGETKMLFGGELMCWPQGFVGVGPHLVLTVNSVTYPYLYFMEDLGIGGLNQGVRYRNIITLSPLDFGLTVPSLEREYVGSVIKSTLTIELTDIAEKDIQKIKNLTVTILNGSGNVVGSYTSDNVSSKTLTLSGCDNMPNGVYTITYTYEDLIGETYSKTTTFPAQSKEPERPKGNYIYSDGTRGDVINNKIVGVVIYDGNPKVKFNDQDLPDQYCNGLAISINSYPTTWGGTAALSSIPSQVKISSTTANYDQGGYSVKKILNDAGLNNLPIYNSSSYVELPSGKTSGWYIGAKNEWSYIYDNLEEINGILSGIAGADKIEFKNSAANGYWLPLNYETSYYKNRAIVVYGGYYAQLTYTYRYNYTDTAYARPIFAF